MDGPRGYHTKWSKSDRERQSYNITYMGNLKKKEREIQMNIFTIQKHRKQTYGYQRRKLGWQANKLGNWD